MDLAKQIGLAVVDAAGRDGAGNPLLEEGEEILERFDDIQLILSSSTDLGNGTLYVTDGRIIWLSQKDLSIGVASGFTSISMHGVATDRETVERPCLYVQIDADYSDEEEQDLDDEENSAFHSLQRELVLVPTDPSQLDAIWLAFCDGAERNPDPQTAEEGQGSLFFNHDEALAAAFDQPSTGHDEDDLADEEDPDRFADADGEQEQTHQNGL